MPVEMQESVERERGKRPREAGGGPGARACRESGTLVAYPSFYKYLNGICASKNVPYLRTFCAWLESGDRRKGAACWRRTASLCGRRLGISRGIRASFVWRSRGLERCRMMGAAAGGPHGREVGAPRVSGGCDCGNNVRLLRAVSVDAEQAQAS